jgi:type IV secretion system protein TrbE
MNSLRQLHRDYREAGAFHSLVGIDSVVAEGVFATKAGSLVSFLSGLGREFECLDLAQLDHYARRFESVLRGLDERFRIRQYFRKRKDPVLPAEVYPDPFLQEIASNRVAHLRARKLSSFETYFAIETKIDRRGLNRHPDGSQCKQSHSRRALNWGSRALRSFQTGNTLDAENHIVQRAAEDLTAKIQSFVLQAADVIQLELLTTDRAFAFHRDLLNYAPQKAAGRRLKFNNFVDYQLCSSALECHRDALYLDDYRVQVLTLKEPPARTFAHMFRSLLDIPSEFVIAIEWQRQSANQVRRLIQSKRRHFHNSKASFANYLNSSAPGPKDMLIDDGAVAVVNRLGECLEEMEVHGLSFGEFSETLILFDINPDSLQQSVAQAIKTFAAHDAQLIDEKYNRLNAYLSILPGNDAYNVRRLWLSEKNHADLSFLYTIDSGVPRNAHLNAPSLATFERKGGIPYFFNLHHQDLAHTLVLGATGSGKSFLLNFLLLSLQKYGGLCTIFDLGGSYRKLCRALGGSYLSVGGATNTATINPFCLPLDRENLQFLFSFVKVLIESNAGRIKAEGERDLYEQIENLYSLDPKQRRLSTLATILHRDLRVPLQNWIEGGPYGSYFDNAEDTLTFSRFQVFDFEGMEKEAGLLEAFLFYVLHRTSMAMNEPANTGHFNAFICDEAWRFFRHPTIKAYIIEALKTWRKKNAAMILATQSTEDLFTSDLLASVVESCPTQLFLANPRMDQAAYRKTFHLSETEANTVANLATKQQILIKQPDGSRVVSLSVDSGCFELCNPEFRQTVREPNSILTLTGGQQ